MNEDNKPYETVPEMLRAMGMDDLAREIENTPPYEEYTEWRFHVLGEYISITEVGESHVTLEDARKNGQEDTHMQGTLVLNDGKLEWEDEDNMFVRYGSRALADAIVQYIEKHGFPRP